MNGKKLLIFFLFIHDNQPSTYPLISRSQEEQYLNDNFKLLTNFKLLEKGSKLVALRRQQLHHNDHVIFSMLFPMQIPMQNDNLSIALKSCYFCVILVRDAEKKQKNTQKELTWVKFWRNSVHHSICTLIICPNSWITLIARPDNIRWFELSLRRRRHLRQSYRILQLHSATMSCSIEEETIIVTTLGLAIGSVKTKKKRYIYSMECYHAACWCWQCEHPLFVCSIIMMLNKEIRTTNRVVVSPIRINYWPRRRHDSLEAIIRRQ